ncbi:hypothetical protein JW964_15370 [candidate division KSB1 bacterium]|nr:hypothetical protein [candidate division KSB1 bacterium]
MSCILNDVKITAFQPKQEKDKETQEVMNRLIIKGDAKLDNSLQITELFTGFRKRLLDVEFSPYDNAEGDFSLSNVSIEDFTVKNKMEKIGSGKEAEKIPVEHVFFTMAVRLDEEGDLLKKMYSVFQNTIKIVIE